MNNENNCKVEVIKPNGKGIFCNYIFKAIPLAFDESLSYYECLCGLLSYLKETILPTLNNNADAIIEVQNKINELQTYVDDYFKNLDVQTEINNKLDEMAQSGELQEIISEYLKIKTAIIFDNIEDMKKNTNLINGSYAKTNGYNIINDGGASFYKIRTKLESDIIDNATIIQLNNNELIAEIIIKNKIINAKQFGAIGDGISDDTINLQKMIDYAINNNLKIYIDKSTYLISSTLNLIGNNINLQCDGIISTNHPITCIYVKGEQNNIKINTLKQNNNYEGTGLLTDGLNRTNININSIINFNKGISFDTSSNNNANGIYYNKIYSNYINANYCIYLNANYKFVNSNYFYLSLLNGNIGIYTEIINNTSNVGEYNGNYFENMGFEYLQTCVELHNASLNKFSNFRLIESVTGDYFFKLLDNSSRNVFNSSSVSALMQNNKIQDTQTQRDNANEFNMNITQYGNRLSQYANKVITYNNIIEIVENNNIPNYIYIEDTDYNFTSDNMNAITIIDFSNNGNDVNIHLDDRFNYNNYYLNNLIISCIFMSGTNQANVYDSKGNKILNIKDDYLAKGKISVGGVARFKFYYRKSNTDNSVSIVPYLID